MIKAKVRRQFEPLSDFELEAYLCDELSAEARARVEACSASDPALRAYLEQRQQARAQFAVQHPLRTRKSRRALFSMLGLGLAAAAALSVMTVLPEADSGSAPGKVRVKGAAVLQASLSVQRGPQKWVHRPEIQLRADDQLMLTVDTDGPGFVTLLGRDTRGEITVYYDALPTAGGRFVSPTSLTLDSQPGDELWLVVFAPEERAADAYAKGLTGDSLDVRHALFQLRKVAP